MSEVLLHARAEKAIVRLEPRQQRQVGQAIDLLQRDPIRSPGATVLKGELAGLHRLRVGEYRVVFQIDLERRQVFDLAIGPRGDIYK